MKGAAAGDCCRNTADPARNFFGSAGVEPRKPTACKNLTEQGDRFSNSLTRPQILVILKRFRKNVRFRVF
jgi:hypothetical protein